MNDKQHETDDTLCQEVQHAQADSPPQTPDTPPDQESKMTDMTASSTQVDTKVEVFTDVPSDLDSPTNPDKAPIPTNNKELSKEAGEFEDLFMSAAPIDVQVVEAISEIYDPEIPVNIYELGLIYEINVEEREEGTHVGIQMTLTSPACPVAGSLPGEVEQKVLQLADVQSVKVDLTWDPPWSPDMMSEAAQLSLGFF